MFSRRSSEALKLLDSLLHGYVERGEGARGHGARRGKAMTRLETHHGLGDHLIECAGGLVGGKIAADQ